MSLDTYALQLPAQAPTVAESVARALRKAILEGALAGGSAVRQEEVARVFGVSRVPVREALLRLEGEGLVETHPRRGVVVTALSTDDFEEILEMRFALESLALRRSAKNFSKNDLEDTLAIVAEARLGLLPDAGPDLAHEIESRWGDLNWKFHRRLYLPANRPRLLASIEQLQQLFARHLRVRMGSAEAVYGQNGDQSSSASSAANLREWAQVLDEHEAMSMACGRHDADAAIEILERHISGHGAELVTRLRLHDS